MTATLTMRHARAAGYCSRGCRAFCEKHGIDWLRFVAEGIPVEELSHIDDAMLQQTIAILIKEAEDGGQ